MYLKNLFPFVSISFLSFLYENVFLKNCNKNVYTYLISLFHHIGSMYIIFGSLFFQNYFIHLIIVVITVSLWKVFNNRCILTVYYNKLCNLPKSYPHKDLVYFMNKFFNIKNLHYYIAFTIITYDIVMIIHNNLLIKHKNNDYKLV